MESTVEEKLELIKLNNNELNNCDSCIEELSFFESAPEDILISVHAGQRTFDFEMPKEFTKQLIDVMRLHFELRRKTLITANKKLMK